MNDSSTHARRHLRRGAIFPQTEIGNDPAMVRDFAQAAEDLGFAYLLAYDHVIGAHPDHFSDFSAKPEYTYETPFHEPLVLFGYLAGVTTRIELATGILVLPQRQTALVAKQAAEVDILSEGRLRLGIGIGWNHVEYEVLGADFANRAARSAEQVEVLRRFWAEPLLDYTGRWHRIDRASIEPRPGREIPIWFGGASDRALRRAVALGDGFIFIAFERERALERLSRLRSLLDESARPATPFGLEAITRYRVDPELMRSELEELAKAGFTHVSVATMGCGFDRPQKHVDALESISAAFD